MSFLRYLLILFTLALFFLMAGCFGRTDVRGLSYASGDFGEFCLHDYHCQPQYACLDEQCLMPEPDPRDDEEVSEYSDILVDTTDDVPPQDAVNECGDSARTIGLGEITIGTTAESLNEHTGSCGGSLSSENIWVLTLTTETDVRISTEGSGFDTVLYGRTECESVSSEIACNDDSGESNSSAVLQLDDIGPGTYYLFVDGFGGESGDYVLTIQDVGDPPPLPSEDAGGDSSDFILHE
jgi:hypothetical protein